MNAKKLSLCGVIAVLSISVAAAQPHGFARSASSSRPSFSRPSMSRPSMSRPSLSSGVARNFSSTSRFAANSNRFNPRLTAGTNHFSGNRNWSGAKFSNGKWCGPNHHHHHHHHGSSVVFLGGFGYPYWYDYYPYGYYDYGQAAYYDEGAGYDGSLVADVQQNLARAGYYYGAVDGIMGPATRRAIRAFERANGLRADGVIDSQLLSTMGIR